MVSAEGFLNWFRLHLKMIACIGCKKKKKKFSYGSLVGTIIPKAINPVKTFKDFIQNQQIPFQKGLQLVPLKKKQRLVIKTFASLRM